MKFKQYNESFVKRSSGTNASKIQEFDGKKFKYTYESGNAYERFTIEMFDGFKLNHIATMTDLGETPNSSSYHNDELESRNRYAKLCVKAEKYVKNLIS
jgi:hypothetical protein